LTLLTWTVCEKYSHAYALVLAKRPNGCLLANISQQRRFDTGPFFSMLSFAVGI